MNVSYTLNGGPGTALDKLTAGIGEALAAAVAKTAEQAVEDAKSLAPVLTGALKAGIHSENSVTTATSASIDVVSDATYSGFVEFGHRTRKGPHQRFVPAQPFMGPAAHLAEANLATNVQDAVKNIGG